MSLILDALEKAENNRYTASSSHSKRNYPKKSRTNDKDYIKLILITLLINIILIDYYIYSDITSKPELVQNTQPQTQIVYLPQPTNPIIQNNAENSQPTEIININEAVKKPNQPHLKHKTIKKTKLSKQTKKSKKTKPIPKKQNSSKKHYQTTAKPVNFH